MAKVPVVWDETVGIAGSIEDYAVIARRKGEVWYLSAIGSWLSRMIEVDVSFLGEGKWRAEIFADGINADRDATDYVRKVETVKSGDKIKINLAPGGGWTARFERKGLFW
jgi:alpha-glucosidase